MYMLVKQVNYYRVTQKKYRRLKACCV